MNRVWSFTTVPALMLGFVMLVALTCGAPMAWAQGVDNNTVFELDGNTQDDPALTGLDWESTFPPGTPLTANAIQDPAPLTIYTTGGSKDTNDVSQWQHKSGSAPDKDNILQAVATARTLPSGDTAVYFAASRFSNDGDAQIGLWFFQQQVSPKPDGTFGPAPGIVATHTDGDLLVLVNFEGGGLTPNIQVFRWVGGVDGAPVQEANLQTGVCSSGPNAGNQDVCAITNAVASPAPVSWGYVPKSGTPGVFPPQSFFEGGVNLTKIFGQGDVPCFSSFLAETRSSSSITAQLKDFAEGSFDLCKITVTKACTFNGVVNGGTALQYTFSGTVKNDGSGTVHNVEVVDTPGASGTQTPANPIVVADSLVGGASAPWSATFVTTSLGFTDAALARAASSPGGAQTVTSTTTAPCIGSVNSAISITKACVPGTSLVDIGNNVVVAVGVSGQVCNNGDTQLSGITLDHDPDTIVTLTSSTLSPGACTTWSASYQPSAISSGDGTIPGRYFFDDVISVTAATPAVGPPLTPPAPGICSDPADLACAGASCAMCPPGFCPTP
jgi:hypothetical protein